MFLRQFGRLRIERNPAERAGLSLAVMDRTSLAEGRGTLAKRQQQHPRGGIIRVTSRWLTQRRRPSNRRAQDASSLFVTKLILEDHSLVPPLATQGSTRLFKDTHFRCHYSITRATGNGRSNDPLDSHGTITALP